MRRGILIVIGLLVLRGTAVGEAHTLPKEAFWQAGLPWLVETEEAEHQPWEMPVYQLSCASCLGSFQAILEGEEEPAALFFLNTSKLSDREIAQALVATALVQPDPVRQGRVFRLLLGEFLNAPEGYLNDPGAWRDHCRQYWDGLISWGGPKPWADALNRLHEQNRLLGLLDVYMTPAWLSMDEDSRRVPVEEDLEVEAWQFRLLMTAEPSLQPDLEAAGGDPVPIRQFIFNPGMARSAAAWREIADEIEKGVLWYWSEAEASNSDAVKQWREQFARLPGLASRKSFYVRTFESVATWKRKGNWSLIDFLSSKAR